MIGHEWWIWPIFFSIVLTLLVFDLGVFNKKDHEIGMRESFKLSLLYIGAGCLFGAWVWGYMGPKLGMEYFTGFFVEKSLSMDNVFVIAMIFNALAIPRIYQHRVLFWGILGAIVMRAIMIGIGASLVQHFSWVLYFFGAFLLFTGIKMLSHPEAKPNIEQSWIFNWLRRHLRVTTKVEGPKFFISKLDAPNKKIWSATPLFLALLMVEIADLIFAVDSIPAIFAITQDPFIVYTSNIFAILGLRALYFALSAMIYRFVYLKYALALVLIFIGVKICIHEILVIPPLISLLITLGTLLLGVIYSLCHTKNK